jgi:hypothetical protein
MNVQRNDSHSASARRRGLQSILSNEVIQAQIGDQLQTRHCKRVLHIDVVWLIVCFGLFSDKSYRSIFRYCHDPNVLVPIRATLTTARKRLSADLLSKLYQGVVTLLAKSKTPTAFYQGMRLMAIDGTLLDCPDTEANRKEFGRVKNQTSHGAFPKVRVVSLCEIATRVLWRSVIGTYHQSEQKLVLPLLEHLSPAMLLLADRHFGIAPIIYRLIQGKIPFLIRVKKSQCFPVQEWLSDGSFISTIYRHKNDRRSRRPGKTVRLIRYQHVDPNRPHSGEIHVLITNLLDPIKYPALELIELYHRRWEEEIAFSEWKVLMCKGRVLRSHSPEMVRQEIWGTLIAHFIIRKLIFEAAEIKKVSPSEISFTGAFDILHARLPDAPRAKRARKRWNKDLLNEIAQEQLPPRANRINPRKLKKRSKAWPTIRDRDRRPPKPNGKFVDCVHISI